MLLCRAVRCEADDKSDEVGEDEGEDEEEVDPPPPPSLRDAQNAMTILLRYFESNKNTTEDEMDKVMDVQKLLTRQSHEKLVSDQDNWVFLILSKLTSTV